MAGEQDVSTLNGLFKDQFHKDLVDVKPDHVILQKGLIDWVPADKMNGEFYSIPTVLRSNQGVSYLGEAGGVAQLSAVANGVMKEAQIKGSELNVRGQLSYKAMSQASAAGPRAFKKASAWLVEDLASVAFTRLEAAALYGQTGLGTVESVTDLTGGFADILITEATFAPGLWITAEGALIDSFTTTTKNNTGTLTISLVTISSRTIKVAFTGTLVNDCAAADVLYFAGSAVNGGTWNEMIGLRKQFTATTGTLFNIDRSAYALIQGNTYASTGKISKAKIVDAAMIAVNKGLMSDIVCLVSTKSWAVLAAEDMALRMFDNSYNKGVSESGAKELSYDSAHGNIKVICHPMVKYGEAFLFNPEDVLWVGSSKPTFELQGSSGERFFRFVDGYNAVELQNYSDIAIYALKPAQAVVMTGITYS